MLSESIVMATIAVKDREQAKNFYGGTLGLKPIDENEGGITYQSGNSSLFVYESQYAGTNQATYATWIVDDIEGAVEDLKSKGMVFEHYDLPGSTVEGDIHVMGNEKAAWFKDPDGNILAVTSI